MLLLKRKSDLEDALRKEFTLQARTKCKSLIANRPNAYARVFYTLVHFFAVSGKTTTLNDQIIG